MEKSKTFTTKNDLASDVREKAVILLNQQLADTFDLFGQTKQAHWNVKGMQFYQLHELFDKLAEAVEEYIDLIAERATALGGAALGTVQMSAASSRLPEYPLDAVNCRQHVEALTARFASLAKTIGNDAQRYDFIAAVLNRFVYRRLRRVDKGVVMRYLERTTGYSPQQLTRLVCRFLDGATLVKRYRARAQGFARKFTVADVRLLAQTDALHNTLSGPATQCLMQRANS